MSLDGDQASPDPQPSFQDRSLWLFGISPGHLTSILPAGIRDHFALGITLAFCPYYKPNK